MSSEITLAVDRSGYDSYLLVVKRTYDIHADSAEPTLSAEQSPLAFADEYYGEAATTSIKSASDFAPVKPMCDIVVVGSAYAPHAQPAQRVMVGLQVEGCIRKIFQVVGERYWDTGAVGFVATEPEYFETMPLVFERAYGGVDASDENPRRHGAHRENLIGVGFHLNADPKVVVGRPLPNLEDPGQPITEWGARTRTVGLAFVSPSWLPRAGFAGTYDEAWRENRYPLLPDDFDERYFQTAPADQIVATPRGGERVTILNMSPAGRLVFELPSAHLPASFIYTDRAPARHDLTLDTVVILPDQAKLHMVWRASVRCVGKPFALREAVVGEQP